MTRKNILATIAAAAAAVSAVVAVCAFLWGDGILIKESSKTQTAEENAIYDGTNTITSKEDSNVEDGNVSDHSDVKIETPENNISETINSSNTETINGIDMEMKIDDGSNGDKSNGGVEDAIIVEEENLLFSPGYEIYRDEIAGPYNTDSFTLIVEELAAKMQLSNGDIWNLGVYPSERISVTVYLIEYETGNVFARQEGVIGDIFNFTTILSGTYYFAVVSDGYKIAYSPNAFSLLRNTSKESDLLPWSICIERENQEYESPFKVCISDSRGQIIKDSNSYVRIVNIGDKNPDTYSYQSVTSNANGILTVWEGINGVDHYFEIEFCVAKGYILQVQDSNQFFRDLRSLGSGICVIDY